jgi:hypothetical protein
MANSSRFEHHVERRLGGALSHYSFRLLHDVFAVLPSNASHHIVSCGRITSVQMQTASASTSPALR